MNYIPIPPRARQTGVALITGLIFLVLLTIIGVTAMQSTMLEEKMAGNLRDENLAFQAAEAALRSGEQYLQGAAVGPFLTAKNATGLYQPALSGTTDWWEIASTWTSGGSRTYSSALSGVGTAPRYIVEDMSYQTKCTNAGCVNIPLPKTPGGSLKLGAVAETGLYRVTARGTGGTSQATIMLQSYYRR